MFEQQRDRLLSASSMGEDTVCHLIGGPIEGRIGERMAPTLDGESIGIPAYVFLEPSGD